LVGRESLDELNALRFKLRAHRWIYVGITASYTVSGLPSDCGNAAHESTANAQDMNMHLRILAKELE
jgi:hypothetical protein